MTEAQLQQAIIEAAQLLSWRVAHFRPAQTSKGWRTPVSADGAGFPDLLMVRNGHLIAAELKSEKGVIAPAQRLWLDELLRVSMAEDRVTTYTWRPSQWLDGSVLRVLQETGQERKAA